MKIERSSVITVNAKKIMKMRNILTLLLMMSVGGMQTTLAQSMKVWHNGEYTFFNVNHVDSVQMTKDTDSFEKHEFVDLGLPSGTLWATCNIGANSPEEYGDYFAWGETEPKSEYCWSTYDFCNLSDTTKVTKYCLESSNGYNGYTDALTELQPEDDAATVNWGANWRMPTKEQRDELKQYCSYEFVTKNNVNGLLITGPSGGQIFLPAAGARVYTSVANADDYGYYWLRSLETSNSCALMFAVPYRYSFWNYSYFRFVGLSVRPVRVQSPLGPMHVTGITLDQTSLLLSIGYTQTLNPTIMPVDALNKNVIWSSSNEDIATVDQTGRVIAKNNGSCVITCTSLDNSEVKSECSVTVDRLVMAIMLSQTPLLLPSGTTQTLTATILPDNATNKSVIWSSSDSNIATVSQTGEVITKTGGLCTITCAAQDGSGVKTECQVIVLDNSVQGSTNGHEWVDLGLPSGTLWSTCNVGASSPEDYGNYYAWGETTPKGIYSWTYYKYCNGSANTLTKYCMDSNNGLNGFTDNLSELLPEDDAATANWGNNWQTPSEAQFTELIDNSYTTSIWTTQSGVDGRIIVSKSSGHYIFLPSSGYFTFMSSSLVGYCGCYWTRSLNTSSYSGNSNQAYYLSLYSGDIYVYRDTRDYGYNVRPVRK